MRHGYFIALVEILGFFHAACSGSGNNSGNTSSSSSSNTTILNNMLAREILQRQTLENRVATLERQITVLISDAMNGQRVCSALQRDVQGISLKQNNMASSLQTITQRVDSENVNMRESLWNLSDITSKLLSKDSQCKYTYFHCITFIKFFFYKILQLNSSPFCVLPRKSLQYIRVLLSVSETPIAFLARISERSPGPTQTEKTLEFDSTEFNYGHAYDASSGTFQAPMAGLYNFQTTIYILSGTFEGYISKNGVPEVYLSVRGIPYQVSDSVSITLSLSHGDRIWLVRTDQWRSNVAPRKSLFSGYLIRATWNKLYTNKN